MQQQETQPARSRSKINVTRMALYTRIILFTLIMLGVVITSILAITTGVASSSTISSGLSTLLGGIAIALAFYATFFPPQPKATIPIINTIPVRQNNIQSGDASQSTGAKTRQLIFSFNLPLHHPGEFYGHTAARTTLIARTARGGSSSIVGERRIGKTWLLEYLQLVAPTHSQLGPSYRVGFVSATDIQSSSLTSFVQWVLEELDVSQTLHDPSLHPLSRLSQAVRYLRQQGIHPVLCIDEFEGFYNKQEFNNDFFDELRALTQSDSLVLVTASRYPLKEVIGGMAGQTSSLYNIFLLITLRPFTMQEAREFVHAKSNMAGFTKKETDFFFNQSTLHNTSGAPYWPPLRLQLVGQILLSDKQDTQGQSLDDQLDNFDYRSNFEKRLNERYHAVV